MQQSHTNVLPIDSDKVKKYKEKIARSAKSGAERKIKLDELEKDNDWVKSFYANYTFEVDFIAAGNGFEIKRIIKDIYTDLATCIKADEDISDGDVAVFGRRVLTMANSAGKGWFAILLGGHITYQTEIPDYIMDALIFSKEDYSNFLLADMIEYRIGRYEAEDDCDIDFSPLRETLEEYKFSGLSLNSVIEEIQSVIEDDQILDFLDRL